jgi:hypothetical protein
VVVHKFLVVLHPHSLKCVGRILILFTRLKWHISRFMLFMLWIPLWYQFGALSCNCLSWYMLKWAPINDFRHWPLNNHIVVRVSVIYFLKRAIKGRIILLKHALIRCVHSELHLILMIVYSFSIWTRGLMIFKWWNGSIVREEITDCPQRLKLLL